MDRFAKLSFAEKLKDKAGILDAAKMVVFDVTVHLPVIYFPTYYTVKEFVGGKTWNPIDWVRIATVATTSCGIVWLSLDMHLILISF
jgi:hypothetical protein